MRSLTYLLQSRDASDFVLLPFSTDGTSIASVCDSDVAEPNALRGVLRDAIAQLDCIETRIVAMEAAIQSIRDDVASLKAGKQPKVISKLAKECTVIGKLISPAIVKSANHATSSACKVAREDGSKVTKTVGMSVKPPKALQRKPPKPYSCRENNSGGFRCDIIQVHESYYCTKHAAMVAKLP